MATTADGKLDFSGIAGTWVGQVEGDLFGNPVGTWRIELEIEAAADRSSVVGTTTTTTAGGARCVNPMAAIDASPPVYEFRERPGESVGDDERPCEGGTRVRLTAQPGADEVHYKALIGNGNLEGVLGRIDGP
ncbi:MAG: hypothetical protein R3343_13405 [Nitriliruptorales bacterium]|nr:hypothetical protein [Nitriliruptorales bacterium]